jgi:hypothetical protein
MVANEKAWVLAQARMVKEKKLLSAYRLYA